MSEKRDSASFPDEETKKKKKLDECSSSGPASDVKQEGDGLEAAIEDPPASAIVDPPASAIVDNLGSLSPLTENKPRIQDDTDCSFGSVPASIHDEDSQTKKTGSLSSSSTASASCSGKDQQPSGSNQRTLLYKKSLTHDDVSFCRLIIPLESARDFLAIPEKVDGKYETIIMIIMDHEGKMWEMEASFDEISSSYMLWLNWDKYLKKYELEAGDVIFIYHEPTIPTFQHYLIEYEKSGRDSSTPKKTTT